MAVREWFAGKEILLTGVTSDIGTAVLDKLLRSCPDTKKIYVVLRSKDTLLCDGRINKIFESPGFARVRQECPDAISRIKILEGNLKYGSLGLTEAQEAQVKNVDVVIHAGGPQDALFEFCRELPALKAAAVAESIFTLKRRGQITESSQDEEISDLPLALIRIPAIGPALNEPMPGHVSVVKGATALMVGAGYALGNPDFPAAIIPVDLAANTLIVSAWGKGTSNERNVTLYNVPDLGYTWHALIRSGDRASKKFPYPSFGIRGMTPSPWLYWLVVLMLEWLPSAMCDWFFNVFGGKPSMVDEHLRIRAALRTMEPILSRSWTSDQNNVYKLRSRLTPEDQEDFVVHTAIDLEAYVLCAAAVVKRMCVDDNHERVITNFKRVLFIVGMVLFLVLFIL